MRARSLPIRSCVRRCCASAAWSRSSPARPRRGPSRRWPAAWPARRRPSPTRSSRRSPMALIDPQYGPATYQKQARPAPETLVRAHMALVRKIAWHVHARVATAIDVEDLAQIGMVALVEAANCFEDRGHAFATYATLRIRGAMIDHLRRHASLCRAAMARRRRLAAVREPLENRLGRAAGDAESARAIGLDGPASR